MKGGELLKATEKASGGRPTKTPRSVKGVSAPAKTLKQLGVSETQSSRWVAEIKLRAVVRIGELSAGLETGKGAGRGKGKELPTGGKFKAEVLKTAGISTSAANRAHAAARRSRVRTQCAMSAASARL